MPISRHRSRSPDTAFAVTAMMGTSAGVAAAAPVRMLLVASKPSIRGIWQSIRTTSYLFSERASSASIPSTTASGV